jgi:uncharacterized SAM-binding protein YcdF (DUF218 family)
MHRWYDLPGTGAMIATAAAQHLRPLLRRMCMAMGACTLLAVALAFTRLPYDAHRWLGVAAGECHEAPGLIVVLGGSGLPSGPELRRLQEAADRAQRWPSATVLLVHPGDPRVLRAMAAELRLRGVDAARLVLLNEGDNTRAQALVVARYLGAAPPSIALVTAPENTCRSVLAFRRAGLPRVCGVPAWDHAMAHGFDYDHRAIGGAAWAPDVSTHPGMRYTWWNYLKLEVTVLRECVALVYYRLNGWA